MALMEFLGENLLNSISTITVDSASVLTQYLHDRNTALKYTTDGYASTTATVITVEFSNPTIISHVLILNTNAKKLRIFYNSLTSNVFSPDFQTTTNDQTNLYIALASKTVNSISLQIDEQMVTDKEKYVGEFVVANRKLQFEQNPDSKKYKPLIARKQIEHKMPDGGFVQFNIKDKFNAKIGLNFISQTFYDNLLSLYEESVPLYFLPFPTTTAWDGRAYPVIWSGAFDFRPSVNAKNAYSGNIILKERTSG